MINIDNRIPVRHTADFELFSQPSVYQLFSVSTMLFYSFSTFHVLL